MPRFWKPIPGSPFSPGDFVDAEGTVLGRHKGIPIIQSANAGGIGLSFPEPRYVIGIDATENRVILGKEGEPIRIRPSRGRFKFHSF